MREIQFAIIPPQILLRHDLSIQDKMIFGLIHGLTTKWGYCYASNQQIGEAVSLSADRISKIISSLRKRGFLSVELTKIKKDQRTGQFGEKYGTSRKIFVYLQNEANPIGVDNQRGVGVDNSYNKNNKRERGGVVTIREATASPNPTVPLTTNNEGSGLSEHLKRKAARKANKGSWRNGGKQVKPQDTRPTQHVGLAMSLKDNVTPEVIKELSGNHGLTEEEVIECKDDYLEWINGSSGDPKVWGKNMKIYVNKFCRQKAAKAESKTKVSKPKDMFEEINAIYKKFPTK